MTSSPAFTPNKTKPKCKAAVPELNAATCIVSSEEIAPNQFQNRLRLALKAPPNWYQKLLVRSFVRFLPYVVKTAIFLYYSLSNVIAKIEVTVLPGKYSASLSKVCAWMLFPSSKIQMVFQPKRFGAKKSFEVLSPM